MDKPPPPRPAIIVHAGAWAIPENEREAHRVGVMAAVRAGWAALQEGKSAIDAILITVRVLENDTNLNAGSGSVLNRDGMIEMDAGIMFGTDLTVGGVAAVRNRRNPIDAANAVRLSEHALLGGAGAESFLDTRGVPTCDPASLVTAREVARLDAWKASGSEPGSDLGRAETTAGGGDLPGDTVGAVCIDDKGRVAAGVSTGGLCGKRSGRIGDTPVPGAGFYADDIAGGAVCTGWGEPLLRMGTARRTVQHLAEYNAQDASWLAIRELEERFGGRGGVVVISRNGSIGFSYNTPHMALAYMDGEIIDPIVSGV